MKWISKDIDLYLQAKEYVDTSVIPLIPVSFGENMKQMALMSEFVSLLSDLLERQFTGRILLLPSFTYMKTEPPESLISRLERFTSKMSENGFKHIFLLTSDSDWKLYEDKLTDDLIWIPALPIGDFTDSQKVATMGSQVNQILPLITRKWHENEQL